MLHENHGYAKPGTRRPVVVYDSGVGGLTVARHVLKLLPKHDVIYLADNAWFPYGDKEEAALSERVHALLDRLIEEAAPEAIIVACNTASTAIAHRLDTPVPIPIFGVLPPIQQALRVSKMGKLALLATPGTIKRSVVREIIKAHSAPGQVASLGIMDLVMLAERKMTGERITRAQILAALDPLMPPEVREEIDVVILGCTHFPHLKEELKAAFPQAQHWIDPALDAVSRVQAHLTATITIPAVGERPASKSLLLTGGHNFAELQAVFAAQGFGSAPQLKSTDEIGVWKAA